VFGASGHPNIGDKRGFDDRSKVTVFANVRRVAARRDTVINTTG
jgi:hypothetical protein